MCGGAEEEVKIFLDIHIYLVRIHSQVFNGTVEKTNAYFYF